ncbi:MAG: DNA repair protein RecO [Planctomycetota bacterium]
MPRARDTAICLRQWDWSETSQVVLLFGRESGIIRGLAKGARRPRSKFDGGLEPLTLGEVVFVRKPTRELLTITDWSVDFPAVHLRRSLLGLAAMTFAAEAIAALFPPLDPAPESFELFSEVRTSLGTSPSIGTADAAYALRVAWRAAAEAGHAIDLTGISPGEDPARTLVLRPEDGRIVPAPPGETGPWRIRPSTLHVVIGGGADAAPAESVARAVGLTAAWIRYRTGAPLQSEGFFTRCLTL